MMGWTVYKTYPSISLEGDADDCDRVEACLDAIADWAHGKKLLGALNSTPHKITIQDSADGEGDATLCDMSKSWTNDLPRVLRAYMTPGNCLSPTVKLDPIGEGCCVHDPATHKRPPTIGLAHELVHALHSV